MEAPSPTKDITFENFNLESDRHKLFNFIFKNENNRSLCISALYREDIISQNYEKTFTIDILKNMANFSLFNSIKEIYEEIIYLIKQKQKEIKVLENSNGIILKIPLEGLKFKEITFYLDEKKIDEKQTIKDLYLIVKNLINKNNILESNQGKLEEKVQNLEKEIKILKDCLKPKENNNKNKIVNLNSLIIGNNDNYNITIKNWISPNNTIKAELLYRLTTNGKEYKTFHDLCDNKGNTLLITKLEDGNILGGFTTKNWDNSNSWKEDKNSFVFSLSKQLKADSNKSISNHIYCHHSNRGPCFGFFLYFYNAKMDKLNINNVSNKYLGCNQLFDGPNQYYKALEVEVFRITLE